MQKKSSNHIKRIETIQNKAIRVINFAPFNSPTNNSRSSSESISINIGSLFPDRSISSICPKYSKIKSPSPLLFLLTNTRSMSPELAAKRTREICESVLQVLSYESLLVEDTFFVNVAAGYILLNVY